MKFGTKVLHAGIDPDPSTGAIMTPIFQTSTYVQDSPGVHKGFEYARTQNPTRNALQTNLAALENAKHAMCYASGLAATDAILKLLEPGDEVVSCNDLYGGTYRIFVQLYQRYGIPFHFNNLMSESELEGLINKKTKLIWLETPTNPLLSIIDIEMVVRVAKKHGIWVCVDNTFASPYLQNPIDLGADLIIHSATKYINGHSDVVMGAAITSDDGIAERLTFIQNASGGVPGPQDCFLCLRGIKTLHIRMDRACQNANEIANILKNHTKINSIKYPGFSDHPQHALAKDQMRNFGAMVSFDLKDDTMEAANQILEKTRIFALAESLGGVESLIGHPASMTHGSIPREERIKNGLNDSLIRLSVGIEDIEDLKKDLLSALD